MNHIQDALKGIIRNRKRYIIVTALTVILVAGITVSSIVWFSAEKVSEDYSERFGAMVTFSPDLRKIFALGVDENGYLQVPEITPKQMLTFSQSGYLKQTLFTASLQVYGDQIQGIDQEKEQDDNSDWGFTPAHPVGEDRERQQPNCVIIGYSDRGLMDEFSMGIRELSQGEFFGENNTCMISQEFAERNGLHIGDTFRVINVDDESQEFILRISGIYLDGTTPQTSGAVLAINNRRNEILVSYEMLSGDDFAGLNLQAVYYLAKPEYADEFEREIREQGLPEVYNVNTDADSYYKMTQPMKGLQKIVGIMFFVTMLTGMLVLILFSVLQIFDRKYELGILRAIGMKKTTLIARMLMESGIICLMGIGLGIGIGYWSAPQISHAILEQQIDKAEKEYTESGTNYGEGVIELGGTQKESVSAGNEIDICFSPGILCFIVASTIFLEVAASSVVIIYCMKKEPMKMLVER